MGFPNMMLLSLLLIVLFIQPNATSTPPALMTLLHSTDRSYSAKYTIQCNDDGEFCNSEFTVYYNHLERKRYIKRVEYDKNNVVTQLLIININGIRSGYSAIANYEGDGRRIMKFRKTDDPMVLINTHEVPLFWKLLRPPSFLTRINYPIQKNSLESMYDNKQYKLAITNSERSFSSTFTSDTFPHFRRTYTFGVSLGNENALPLNHVLENDKYKESAKVMSMSGDHASEIVYEVNGVQSFTTKLSIHEFQYLDKSDANFFSLESMGLKVGTLIGYPELTDMKQYPVWNGRGTNETFGDEFERQKLVVSVTPDTPKPSLISQAWPYFLGFVVFAVIGFWLLRKQRQAAKEG